MKKTLTFLAFLAVPLLVGTVSSFFSSTAMDVYDTLVKPMLSPPGYVFGIVWTILFILMGISSYLVYIYGDEGKTSALKVYAAQLAINFFWSILFFTFNMYIVAFIWLVILVFVVIKMIVLFYNQSKLAAALQIPYLFWLLFAGYLNLSIYFLN